MSPIIVALDFSTLSAALNMASCLDPKKCRVKVGKELFTACGPQVVEALQLKGFDVFLDLKFHDIPNTVAKACVSAAELGVWMINVHVSSGRKALETAVAQIKTLRQRPLLIGMTVLSSLTTEELNEVGIVCKSPAELVLKQAKIALDSGMDGIVCSAKDLEQLKGEIPKEFIRVTPGIRPFSIEQDDQARIATPQDALLMGSTYLVIGRPITASSDPGKALAQLVAEIENPLH